MWPYSRKTVQRLRTDSKLPITSLQKGFLKSTGVRVTFQSLLLTCRLKGISISQKFPFPAKSFLKTDKASIHCTLLFHSPNPPPTSGQKPRNHQRWMHYFFPRCCSQALLQTATPCCRTRLLNCSSWMILRMVKSFHFFIWLCASTFPALDEPVTTSVGHKGFHTSLLYGSSMDGDIWLFPEVFQRCDLSMLNELHWSFYLRMNIYPYPEELQVPCYNYYCPH